MNVLVYFKSNIIFGVYMGIRESSFNMTRRGDEDIDGGSENF